MVLAAIRQKLAASVLGPGEMLSLQAALARTIVRAPGNVFSPAESAGDFMRFNVAQMTGVRVSGVLQQSLTAPVA